MPISIWRRTRFTEYDFAAANDLLLQARKLAPRHPGVHMLMGTAASYCGELDDALNHLDAAQEVDPLFPAIRANRGVAYYFCRHFDDANRVFLELLTEYPQRTSTRVSFANSLALSGAYAAARNELNAVIEHDPTTPAPACRWRSSPRARATNGRQRDRELGARRRRHEKPIRRRWRRSTPTRRAGRSRGLAQRAAAHEGGFAECQVDPMLEPVAATGVSAPAGQHGLRWRHD